MRGSLEFAWGLEAKCVIQFDESSNTNFKQKMMKNIFEYFSMNHKIPTLDSNLNCFFIFDSENFTTLNYSGER